MICLKPICQRCNGRGLITVLVPYVRPGLIQFTPPPWTKGSIEPIPIAGYLDSRDCPECRSQKAAS